jgi:hypothetical protein
MTPTMKERFSRIPASVVTAVVALGLLQVLTTVAVWEEATSPRGFLVLLLRLAVMLGLLFRKRLAWAYVRYLGFALAILNPLLHAADLFPDDGFSVAAAIYVIVSSGLLVCASLALGRRSAILFFGLVCPVCGRRATALVEIPSKGRPCRGCGYVWAPPDVIYSSRTPK